MLNRLAALRMMEARGLLRVAVGKGYQSEGFQLYAQVAGGAMGDTGITYQTFLFSLFDEFAGELKLLCDRHSPHGRLFPREPALLELLGLINGVEIAPLWAEDETIGWIYQYFNSVEERKEMRKASAPRNSRELAVRNQFFTPRYVVEFLVDNSLGRQWYEITGGRTALFDQCQYMLIKPDERERPEPDTIRDPRSLKLLDPACGSMHFGLYAFDLFEVIYRESWEWEQQHGPGTLTSDQDYPPLAESFDDMGDFQRQIPKLIIENNIHGVDIDPRAAQIATLALWLRAQRAWNEADVKSADRPIIERGNVFAAVAPPAEPELREQIMSMLDEGDAVLFEKTLVMLKDLPEMGILLRTERELPELVSTIFRNFGPMFKAEDQDIWLKAERRLRDALRSLANVANTGFQGRMYARDALDGMRLIDLVREPFDVVVMNPPFGALSSGSKSALQKAYPRSKNDLLAIFVERGLELMRPGGRLGAITSRTCFFLSSYQKWREQVVLGMAEPECLADLGHGVMDDAMVEAAAYVLEKSA